MGQGAIAGELDRRGYVAERNESVSLTRHRLFSPVCAALHPPRETLELMGQPPTGRLKSVPLREAWVNEATEFTPWLAQEEHIKILGDELGLVLEVEAQERHVGPFRADILCKNTDDRDSLVLIENQLERTDHTHLGQLLTYASGLDAVTIIWIAERFTEEHRATLDWLNEITDERFNFFGVEIQLFRIGSSPVAPHFLVASKPNNWSRRIRRKFSPTEQMQLRFWTALKEHAEHCGTSLRFPAPQPQNWIVLGIGRAKFWIEATVKLRAGEVSAGVVLQTPATKADFRQFLSKKDVIEAEAGESFVWREMPEKMQSRIELRRKATPNDDSTWPEIFEWFIAKLELIHSVFGPRVRDLTLADPDNEE